MNISGVLVHARPERVDAVARALADLASVEVHATAPNGRLVVTIEEPDGVVGKTILQIERLPDVLAAALVYQRSEPDSHLEETCDVDLTA